MFTGQKGVFVFDAEKRDNLMAKFVTREGKSGASGNL